MSAYIVNNETIHAIVKGFRIYGVEYKAEGYERPIQVIIESQKLNDGIGQSLMEQNYKSVNYRYNKNTKAPKYHFEDVEVNEGILLGCINCYNYQACETNDYFESDLYYSLNRLKNAMLKRLISEKGQEIPWGYESI